MTACKSAAKGKKKTDVRQKALCIQPHSWGRSSRHVQVKTDIPQSTCILMCYQNQCKPCTDTYWKGRRQPMVMKAVWTSSHHFQCWPGTAGFCLNFSLETLLRPLNSVHKVGQVSSTWTITEDISVIYTENLKLSSDLSGFVISMVEWSVSPQYTENPKL